LAFKIIIKVQNGNTGADGNDHNIITFNMYRLWHNRQCIMQA